MALFITSCDHDLPVSIDGESPTFGPSPMEVLNDDINGIPIVIAATKAKDLIVSFKRTLDGEVLNFYPTPADPPIALIDESGTLWDIFGFAVSGEHYGKRLEATNSMVGFWFSFATFYPGLKIYPSDNLGANEGKVITGSGGWSVPSNEIRDGGPGKDGIPAIESPKFTSVKDNHSMGRHGIQHGH